MNFDDLYMLKLSIKISDYDNALKYFKKVNKKKIDNEVTDIISNYCSDLRIFQMFAKEKIFSTNTIRFFLTMLKNPVNNLEIIDYVITNKNGQFDKNFKTQIFENNFYSEDSQSIILDTMRNTNINKKLKILDLLLNLEEKLDAGAVASGEADFNFNSRNSKGQSNSQMLILENPTNADYILLEKIENLQKWKTDENKFLFKNESFIFNDNVSNKKNTSIEKEIQNYLRAPEESYKIGFADVEYNLTKLNLKLRKMYEVNPFYLIKETPNEEKERFAKIHMKTLDDVIFNKILLDKI